MGSTDPVSCETSGAVRLPDGAFVGGTENASLLMQSDYEAGQGPGLYVVARDAFRVYLNGQNVVESSAAREGVFVPLTLLPGDNVLSVVASAAHGTPVALVELDELDTDTTSDDSWKVSTSPESGFANPGFDDTSWPAATDYGAVGALPECDPSGSFPADSAARWIGPAPESGESVVLRKVIRIAPVGYGADATGGESATPVLVSTWDELVAALSDPDPAVVLLDEGEHDFRTERPQDACPSICSNDMTTPHYDVLTSSETCPEALVARTRSERSLEIAPNKTLVGLGRGALVRGVNFQLFDVENVVVRNLAVYDVNPLLGEAGDAFSLEGARRIWFDHVTTKWISDGFSDVSPASDDITFSWMHYDGVTPGACRGFQTQAISISDAKTTIHHSFFDHAESHTPRVDGAAAIVHVFNNVFSDNGSYAVASNCNSEVLVEANTFERVSTPTHRDYCADDTGLGKIDAPAGSNDYAEDVGDHQSGDGDKTEPHDAVTHPTYTYELDPPNENGPRVADRAGAGGLWPLPLSLD